MNNGIVLGPWYDSGRVPGMACNAHYCRDAVGGYSGIFVCQGGPGDHWYLAAPDIDTTIRNLSDGDDDKAKAILDKMLIDAGYTLCNTQEELNKYLLLI